MDLKNLLRWMVLPVGLWLHALSAWAQPSFENIPCWAADSVLARSPKGRVHTFSFDCVPPGFHGYFALSRWTVEKQGPGGKRARGASGLRPSEAPNQALLWLEPGVQLRMSIVLPAEGLVQFDWQHRGASLKASCTAGRRSTALAEPAGRFLSPSLRQGTHLELSWQNTGTERAEIVVQNFTFFTPAHQLRIWPQQGGGEHFELFLRPKISQIILPPSISLSGRESLLPEHTGSPILAGDGQPLTKRDQYVLADGAFNLQVQYKDTYQLTESFTILHRHWIIEEPCTGNQLSGIQEIRMPPHPSIALPYVPDSGP